LSGDDIILCDLSFIILCDLLNHMVQEGTFVRDTLALQVGSVCSRNRSKA
jgi:hypothetical protein